MDVSQVVGIARARARVRERARDTSRERARDVSKSPNWNPSASGALARVALGDEKSDKLYDRLMTIDPARSGYYRDVIARGVL